MGLPDVSLVNEKPKRRNILEKDEANRTLNAVVLAKLNSIQSNLNCSQECRGNVIEKIWTYRMYNQQLSY